MIAGFRNLSDRQERQEEWVQIKAKILEELQSQIKDIIIPAAAAKIILVKIKPEATAQETRDKMFTWARQFKEAKPEHQASDEETPRTFVAFPSKSFSMRQRDGQLTALLEAIEDNIPEDARQSLRLDMGKGHPTTKSDNDQQILSSSHRRAAARNQDSQNPGRPREATQRSVTKSHLA